MAHTITPINVHSSLDFALRQSDWVDAAKLAADGPTVNTRQAPAGAKYVLFSGNGDFWCRITPEAQGAAVAAAVPAADVTTGGGSELNPSMRILPDILGAYISLISGTGGATLVSIQYFRE